MVAGFGRGLKLRRGALRARVLRAGTRFEKSRPMRKYVLEWGMYGRAQAPAMRMWGRQGSTPPVGEGRKRKNAHSLWSSVPPCSEHHLSQKAGVRRWLGR